MISVERAEEIINQQLADFGTETVDLNQCLGRVLAEELRADRDLPPFNRVTMDGIAVSFDALVKGVSSFYVKATQSAGEIPVDIDASDECIEIMTGASLPSSTNTVIPYEEIELSNQQAKIKTSEAIAWQNIHKRGSDKKKGQVLAEANQFITPALVAILATIGKKSVKVKKNPSVLIVSTGDELVDITDVPESFQVRRSNNHTLQAILKKHQVIADMIHIPDNANIIHAHLKSSIENYDVILLSGGVSKGKFDYVPQVLVNLKVDELFHGVQQRPGKPFWFGKHPKGTRVFAFPGNPVSTFMCAYRYFLPWLKTSWQVKTSRRCAVLDSDVVFKPALQYFILVKLHLSENGALHAVPVEGNGSGDFANLQETDAFMELPRARNEFRIGEVFPIWPFNQFAY